MTQTPRGLCSEAFPVAADRGRQNPNPSHRSAPRRPERTGSETITSPRPIRCKWFARPVVLLSVAGAHLAVVELGADATAPQPSGCAVSEERTTAEVQRSLDELARSMTWPDA